MMMELDVTHMTYPYSPGEKKVLKMLRKEPQTTKDLCERFYRGHPEPPYNQRQVMVGLVSGLMEKAKRNRERFTVHKTKRSGPKSIEFWIER